jgi:hypothetical protein
VASLDKSEHFTGIAEAVRATDPAFSNKGDSGACVFTLDGRVVGLLNGGAAASDVTTSKVRRTMSEMDLRQCC